MYAIRSYYEHQLKTIAFPNISTGVYHFPKTEAAKIAITTVRKFLNTNSLPETVIFCVFDDENLEIYSDLLEQEK